MRQFCNIHQYRTTGNYYWCRYSLSFEDIERTGLIHKDALKAFIEVEEMNHVELCPLSGWERIENLDYFIENNLNSCMERYLINN